MTEFWRGALTVLSVIGGLACFVYVGMAYVVLTMDIGPFWFLDGLRERWAKRQERRRQRS